MSALSSCSHGLCSTGWASPLAVPVLRGRPVAVAHPQLRPEIWCSATSDLHPLLPMVAVTAHELGQLGAAGFGCHLDAPHAHREAPVEGAQHLELCALDVEAEEVDALETDHPQELSNGRRWYLDSTVPPAPNVGVVSSREVAVHLRNFAKSAAELPLLHGDHCVVRRDRSAQRNGRWAVAAQRLAHFRIGLDEDARPAENRLKREGVRKRPSVEGAHLDEGAVTDLLEELLEQRQVFPELRERGVAQHPIRARVGDRRRWLRGRAPTAHHSPRSVKAV
eukprot:1513401-Prymnesium_polylepis.1